MRTSHSHQGTMSFMKQKCLPLPCLVSFLTFSCISPFTFLLSLQPYFTVMDNASLEALLLSQISLQWDIKSKEPICIHANEAESVHPSCWACQYTLMTTHHTHTHHPSMQWEPTDQGNIIFSFFPISGLSDALLAAIYFSWGFSNWEHYLLVMEL